MANELNQLNAFNRDAAGTAQAMTYYRGLSNDALRVLAGLPGNEHAFTQVTIQPLDPTDPVNANRRGPDNPEGFVVDPTLRAYVDTLDGRSTNRYFYRSTYVDGAHNASNLSLSSPPVYLPNVVPPRPPVITKVIGGDRQIKLCWASNREPNLVEYRVYRAGSKDDARDIRLMTLVHVAAIPASDPESRPAVNEWIDSVPGGVGFYYRLVAVDDADNISMASNRLVGQAYDNGPPAEPIWIRSEWVKLDADGNEHAWSNPQIGLIPSVALTFKTSQANVTAIIQRQFRGGWRSVTPWVRSPEFDAASEEWVYTAHDRRADPAAQQVYRAKLVSGAGVILESSNVRTVSPP